MYSLDGGTLNNSGDVQALGSKSRGVWMPAEGWSPTQGKSSPRGVGTRAALNGRTGVRSTTRAGTISGANAGVLIASGAGRVTNAAGIDVTTVQVMASHSGEAAR